LRRTVRRLKNDLLHERRARRSEIPPSTVLASERLSPSGRERVRPAGPTRSLLRGRLLQPVLRLQAVILRRTNVV
jgi:hypothetical protein